MSEAIEQRLGLEAGCCAAAEGVLTVGAPFAALYGQHRLPSLLQGESGLLLKCVVVVQLGILFDAGKVTTVAYGP